MSSRTCLHNILVSILRSNNVYYSPPESVKIQYPAILYWLDRPEIIRADNSPYLHHNLYRVTLVSKDPEDEAYFKLLGLPMCRNTNNYNRDNLHHSVFEIYVKGDTTQ